MKSKILLLALTVAALSSCTTAYKTGQTPDDVYYSPAPPEDEYVQSKKQDDRQYRNNDDEYYDDQFLRMKVRNRSRWSDLDDPYYSRYSYNYYNSYNYSCFSNPWTPFTYWNNHYNPYYQSNIVINPAVSVAYNGPRTFNLNSYNSNTPTNGTNSNPKFFNLGSNSNNNNNTYTAPRNNNSNNSNAGNLLRNIFGGNNNNSSGNSSNNNNNSSSSSSSSSGSSSSGSSTPAPVRKF